MGHHHSAIAAEASTSPVIAANVAATNAVANATGVSSPETKAQQAAATAVINATGETQATPVTTVSDCCAPHVNLALSGVTSAQAHSYLMNLYEKNACEQSYLEELYNKCNVKHHKAAKEPSYLNELFVEDCHAEHIADKCQTAPVAPTHTTDPAQLCSAAKSVCTATGATAPACLAAKAQCVGEATGPVAVEPAADGMCPAAQSVCTAVGLTNPACVAAKGQCAAELQELSTVCAAARSVCTATGAKNPACVAAKKQCPHAAAKKPVAKKQVVVVENSAEKCPAAVSVCTATGDASVECTAAKEQCVADLQAKKVTTEVASEPEVVVVQDSAKKCPAAVSVCQATGDASVECTAAKEQCVADLKAKKVTHKKRHHFKMPGGHSY